VGSPGKKDIFNIYPPNSTNLSTIPQESKLTMKVSYNRIHHFNIDNNNNKSKIRFMNVVELEEE
jgi:hypothetical protein